MKCKKCGERASIKMTQHNMALCQEHFLDWLPQHTQRTIEKFRMFTPDDKVLVAVSGGKDSLALWDVLLGLGYRTDGIYIDLGITDPQSGLPYSAKSKKYSLQFAEQHNLNLHIVDMKQEYGETITEINHRVRHGRQKPCSICGLVKRHILNEVTREGGYPVLVTGHNLDDEAATLFGNTLTWTVDLLQRQAPLLPAMSGFARKAKPFCKLYERETAAYALMRNIAYVYEECPFAGGARTIQHKKLLNQLEKRSPGTKMQFYGNFLKAREELFAVERQPILPEEHCPVCGQPTHSGQLCAFCRLVGKM